MSGFKALNIESDDESDVEIDDTKELQIEEALKLYQSALRYHSEGPASFELAAQAYEELFQSDIFKYSESQTELRRIELHGALSETEDLWQDGSANTAVPASLGLDTGPSTLPQILHLSHKNYAQFKLEYLTAKLDRLNVNLSQILNDATIALDHFVEALDKDDSDLDLWRRTASVGGMLNSQRVARFCLEAVLDGDDEGLGGVLSLPGLEEGIAGEQLRHLVGQFEDQLSLLQAPLSTGKRRVLSKLLKQRLSSYQSITDRESALRDLEAPQTKSPPERVVVKAPQSWAEMGEILLRQLMAEQHGTTSAAPGVAISFDVSSLQRPQLLALERVPSALELVDAEPILQEEPSMPETINEQFPGLDKGQPTVQPQIASAEQDAKAPSQPSAEEDVAMVESPTMTLPTRKRSGDAAGLNESPEEGRTKSKRTRTRESTTAEDGKQAIMDANTRWELEQKLAELQAADDWTFETVGNLFERIGIVGFEAGKNVRGELSSPTTDEVPITNGSHSPKDGLRLAKSDLQAFLNNYSDQLAQVLMVGGESLDVGQGASTSGFTGTRSNGSSSKSVSKPALKPNTGLVELLEDVNRQWLMTEEVAWLWLEELLRPDSLNQANTYLDSLWPENLKTMLVRTLVNFDESITTTARDELERWKQNLDAASPDESLAGMIETIFELHLDIFCLIKQSNSGVDADTVAAQSDRLQQWSRLAREAMHFRSLTSETANPRDELSLRFLWATTFAIAADSDVSQAHVIDCMNDLRANFVEAEEPIIQLQNNAIMPELSITALDREISRLTTKDFFLKVTSQDEQDPVAIIESLEPLLGALMDSPPGTSENGESEPPTALAVLPELVQFLESSDVSVRLLLWQRLRDAYLSIDYKPMVISCYFKMIRLLLNELRTTNTAATGQADRQVVVLKTLRLVQDMSAKSLAIIQSSKNAFECIDEDGLKAAVTCFGEVLQLLQIFSINEDSIRIGQSQAPSLPSGLPLASFSAVNSLVHNIQVHIWIILYGLLKEALFQFHELFPTPAEDTFEFLKVVHRNLGLRAICGSSNRAFVRLLKDEFFQMTHVEGYESEQAQVLYDLYGLNCFLNPNYELMEHNCTHDAFIDRSVALQAVDLLLLQASKLPMKDLVKHPIRDTIDKVHGAAPRKKPTDAIMRNREVQRAFLRSPINPLDLYSCLKGEGNQLSVSPIPKEDALLASKGWYFLMGHIALTKFRSQKRTGPTPTEDVDIAIAFFMQDLEFSADNWETWFRLAQAYDTKIEESVVWSAEKLNNSMNEIVQLQRAAIHCYTMATALAYRSAELGVETTEKMTELFLDFAVRLYSSSREPFGMLPFALDDTEKFFSFEDRMGKGKPFQPLRPYTVWKLVKVLLQRVLAVRSESWNLHFTLGKVLWKMHTSSDHARGRHNTPPTAQEVLSSFIRAIELVPDKDKKDSREKREPVLEPHYKLVSVVHKLVSKNEITLTQARETLNHTPYARTVTFPEELDEWVPHVLAVFKTLRAADKSNWHHRMIARAAQIVYDDSDPRADLNGPSQNLGAMGAKHELTQQMFTKTMVLQVWRPECERAGRHFVYTSRYTRFFVRILEQLRDRTNLEMLARRVRRRPHDLFEHALVWQDICNAYLRLLRSYAALPEGLETSTFSTIAHEDFIERKEPLEKWMKAQETGSSPSLDVLREVQELKKINQSLMKPGPIDDLIGDSYAYLFNTIGKQLWDEERRVKQEEEANRPQPVVSPPRNPMMSLTHLMNVDGTNELLASTPPAAPIQPIPPTADPAPARRKIGVGRREIRTCAEACFQKPNVAATMTTTRTLPRVQVVIDSSKEHVPGDVSVGTSAPGSIHDSADDESELSELEEEEVEDENGNESPPAQVGLKPMFPGLMSRLESRDVSEGFETAEEGPVAERVDVEMEDHSGNAEVPVEEPVDG